jgi:hypothetical protein
MKSTKKTSKLESTKPLPAVGSQPDLSAKIGGVGNEPQIENWKKGKGGK